MKFNKIAFCASVVFEAMVIVCVLCFLFQFFNVYKVDVIAQPAYGSCDPVNIRIDITNKSNRFDMQIEEFGHSGDASEYFYLKVINLKGLELEPISSKDAYSTGYWFQISAGSTSYKPIDLRTIYKLDPGTYTVKVGPIIAPQTTNMTKSLFSDFHGTDGTATIIVNP